MDFVCTNYVIRRVRVSIHTWNSQFGFTSPSEQIRFVSGVCVCVCVVCVCVVVCVWCVCCVCVVCVCCLHVYVYVCERECVCVCVSTHKETLRYARN